MYIHRDITQALLESDSRIQLLLGPRQCGKSTLCAYLLESKKLKGSQRTFQEINFDDLQLRELANRDPALFLQQFEPPLLLDEVQYVPNLFPELKKVIDNLKRKKLFSTTFSEDADILFRLTGSNQILMDKNVKESLAGRAAYFYLNTLTVHEILNTFPEIKISEILFKGGWPELYINSEQAVNHYLNDYIRSYLEKDIVLSAGIQKISEFHTVLGLLAARTAQLIDYTSIANDSSVKSVTIKEWIGLLERTDLIYTLKPYFSNLNKRLIKTPKLYFLDTGLAARLQGWLDSIPLLNSPLAGNLFETLVLAEIVKFIRNYRKDWQLYFWRTKEGEEIDILIETSKDKIYAFECKLSLAGLPEHVNYPDSYQKHFSPTGPIIIVTLSGQQLKLSKNCSTLPVSKLHDHLTTLE